jgi:serine/threonine protein kinase
MIENGTILENRYLIERQIGEGGMGAVYLATDQRFDSPVAIKETFYNEADLREAFEREARLLNSLHHPVLPHVSDFFSAGAKHFLVMEYIEGEDLSEVLKQAGAFDANDVMRWTDSLLDALDFLHSQEPPIIHRDIKPNNLKITPRGDIVLLDFGLAKLSSAETTQNSVFGYSRKYSPLEQIQGTGTDARSDIFSLGATVFHLLTGQAPVDVLARASAIVAGKPDPLPLVSELNSEISPGVAQVLNTALMLNPDSRFASAKAARAALQHALNFDQVSDIEQAAIVAPAIETHDSETETENFPALESFVETQDSHDAGDVRSPAVQISIPPVNSSPQQRKTASPQTAAVTDAATQVQRLKNRVLLPLALAAAILIWGSLAVWLVTKPAKSSSEEPAQQTAPVVQQSPMSEEESANTSESVSVAESSETLDDSALPEMTPEISSEPLTKEKPEPRKINKTATEKVEKAPKQTAVEVEEKPAKAETPVRPQTRQAEPKPRQQSTQNSPSRRATDIESRPRVVPTPKPGLSRVINSAPLGDVQTQPRNARRNQMSDAEKEELRRRRLDSILRHNRQPNRKN